MLSSWAYLLAALAATAVANEQKRAPSGCKSLETKFGSAIAYPGSASYTNETTGYWSKSVILTPGPLCVFTPKSAADVAGALPILRSTSSKFAVKGNGHMTVKGANDINNGILIALSQLRQMNISSNSEIASIGPGLTWTEVYTWASKYSKALVGARYAPVGVSGLLLGGGISFHGPQYGWAADKVVNYEVVTADGKIIYANKDSNADLWWALKGGGSNFGIVTRFDVQTIPSGQIFAGTISYDSSNIGSLFKSLQAFAEPGGGQDNPKIGIMPNLFLDPSSGNPGNQSAGVTAFYNGPDGSALQNFTSISTASTAKTRTYADFIAESGTSGARGNFRGAFHVVSFKSSAQTVRLINDTVTVDAVKNLKNLTGVNVGISYQWVPKSWLQAAKQSGGDAIDIDPSNGDLLILNLVTQWQSAADDDTIANWTNSVIELLKKKATALGLYFPFIYLNDAQEGANPFPLYGNGKSLQKLLTTRRKYDKDAVFQDLMPGGFKLGK